MSRTRSLILVMALIACLTPMQAIAAKYDAPRKFGRGLAGMTCGFLELPGNIVKTTREKGIGYGLTLGVAEGAGRIVVRTLVGVYEFVTAPFPAPPGYKPVLSPEYPWGYFD